MWIILKKVGYNMFYLYYYYDYMYSYVIINNKKVLFILFLIIGLYMFIEIIGGFFVNSLVLLFDGIYMFSDIFLLGVVFVVFIYVEKNVIIIKIFGYKCFEVFVVLFNGVMFFVISILIVFEVIKCFFVFFEV